MTEPRLGRARFPFASAESDVVDPFDGDYHESTGPDGRPSLTRVLPCCAARTCVARVRLFQCMAGLDTRLDDRWDFFHDDD